MFMQSNSIWGWKKTSAQPSLKPASVIKNDKRNRAKVVDCKIGRLAENCEWLWGTLRQAITLDRAISTHPKPRPSSSRLLGWSESVSLRLSYEWIWITLGRWDLPSSAICFPSARKGSVPTASRMMNMKISFVAFSGLFGFSSASCF